MYFRCRSLFQKYVIKKLLTFLEKSGFTRAKSTWEVGFKGLNQEPRNKVLTTPWFLRQTEIKFYQTPCTFWKIKYFVMPWMVCVQCFTKKTCGLIYKPKLCKTWFREKYILNDGAFWNSENTRFWQYHVFFKKNFCI